MARISLSSSVHTTKITGKTADIIVDDRPPTIHPAITSLFSVLRRRAEQKENWAAAWRAKVLFFLDETKFCISYVNQVPRVC